MGRKQHLWYLDSGCSKHMTGDASKFINIFLKQDGHVTYGDNNKGKILGKGTIGNENSLLIHDVLYVEGLKHSLISISQLCDRGYQVTFRTNSCEIRLPNSLDISSSTSIDCLLSKHEESWLWHRRISHIHMNTYIRFRPRQPDRRPTFSLSMSHRLLPWAPLMFLVSMIDVLFFRPPKSPRVGPLPHNLWWFWATSGSLE